MRAWAVSLVVASVGCGGASQPLDAAGVDAGADGGPDAAIACGAPRELVYSSVIAAGPGDEWISAIAPDPIDGTFVIGGTAGHQGFRGIWSDTALRSLRTYGPGGDSELDDVAVDTHGNVTLGGWLVPPASVERVSVASTGSSSLGWVGRIVNGVTPTVTTLDSPGAVEVRAVSRRGDGYFAAGQYSGSLDVGSDHCDGPSGAFVAAFTFEGTPSWLRCITGFGGLVAWGVTVHDAGDAYVVGSFTSTISIDGGGTTLTARGASDGFVARFGGSGDPLWLRAIGTADPSAAESLSRVVVSGSRVIAVGAIGAGDPGIAPADAPLGGLDGAIAVLDLLHGDDIALERVGGAGDDGLAAIAVDRCGGAWVVGAAGASAVVRHFDVQTLATDYDAFDATTGAGITATAVGVTLDGAHVLVGGRYEGTPTIAGTTLPAPMGASDPFVLGIR